MSDGSPPPIFPTPVVFPVSAEHETWQRNRVVEAALSWVGTPYRQLGYTKGPQGAVDCSMLLVAAFVEAGVFQPFDPRPYSPIWFLHKTEERYLKWLDTIGERTMVTLRPGDIVTYQFGQCVSHTAIVVDGEYVVHAFAQSRMCIKTERDFGPLQARERVCYDMWARLRGRT